MEIEIAILNNELFSEGTLPSQPTWHSRIKSYKSDYMDEDMKVCTVSHYVQRVSIVEAHLNTAADIDSMIEFLTNCRPSFKV